MVEPRLVPPALRRVMLLAFALLALMVLVLPSGSALAQSVPSDLQARPEGGTVPGGTLGAESDSDMWRAIRQGAEGRVTIPNPQARQLIQSDGENWRITRNAYVSTYGSWAILGIIALLALFFLLRGRIRIEHGRAGVTITRFGFIERMAHWLLAGSFIILGLTGLNILYGRYVLAPLIGREAFGTITLWGKLAHNYIAFAFMVGLALVLVLWIGRNLPSRRDIVWLAKGGGMFTRGVHPPAGKFNAGQKILFWLVILGGVSISLSGLALMFPFELPLFAKTFAALNWLGFDLPTSVTPLAEMQLAQLWHAIMGLFLIVVIIGHIYIGTLGMEGAFDAMGSGEVDLNWAREHHSVWVEEEMARDDEAARRAAPVPAE